MNTMNLLTKFFFLCVGLFPSHAFLIKGSDKRIRSSRLMVFGETSKVPSTNSGLLKYSSSILLGFWAAYAMPKIFALASQKISGTDYPIIGSESIMAPKEHGTSRNAVQSALKWGCDVKLADRICNFNRRWAEHAGYWTTESSFLKDVDPTVVTTFYDSVTGVPLFHAPVNRTFEEFVEESRGHGWPSFRDAEVVWENVRCLGDGETVSLTGTHLGHNLPDFKGNRYCINLVSIAGNPV